MWGGKVGDAEIGALIGARRGRPHSIVMPLPGPVVTGLYGIPKTYYNTCIPV